MPLKKLLPFSSLLIFLLLHISAPACADSEKQGGGWFSLPAFADGAKFPDIPKIPDWTKFDLSFADFEKIKAAASRQYDTVIADLEILSPLIEKIGFEIRRVSIDWRIPPKGTMRIVHVNNVPLREVEAIVKSTNSDLFVRTVLEALLSAKRLQATSIPAFKNPIIDVRLGLPPRVKTTFIAPGERLPLGFDTDHFVMNESE